MTDTKERELLREIVAYCKEHGHDWSNLAEAEILLARPAPPCPVPAGHALVPVEPTEEMVEAAAKADDEAFDVGRKHGASGREIYSAMISASPTQPATGEGDAERQVIEAARNLVKVKGRHHSEQAYQRLVTAVDALRASKGET